MGIVDQQEKKSSQKEFDDRIKSFAESIKTPMEKFTEQMDFIQEALSLGKITEKQFDLGASAARANAFGEEKLPSLIRSGSAESLAARYGDGRSVSQNNPQVQATKESTKALIDKLGRIERAIERSVAPVMDIRIA